MPEYRIPVTTTGTAGSATGSAVSEVPIKGIVTAVRVTYNASAPATTTVNVDETSGVFLRRLVQRAASNTSGTFYPAVQLQDNAGTAVAAFMPVYVPGEYVTVSVAASNALVSAVVVTIVTDDGVRR